MNTFGPFQNKIVSKIWKFWVYFVANIGKMLIEIIRRIVTSNMRVFSFYHVWVALFPTAFCVVISAECMNIIEIDILSLLDNTRYFIPQITVILS